jgi:hypothetical protein
MAHEPEHDHDRAPDPAHPTHAQETAARSKLGELEYPRMVNHADGTQTRVENAKDAEKALADGATLVPTAPAPDDGGTPNTQHVVLLTATGNPGLNPVRVEKAVVLPDADAKKKK